MWSPSRLWFGICFEWNGKISLQIYFFIELMFSNSIIMNAEVIWAYSQYVLHQFVSPLSVFNKRIWIELSLNLAHFFHHFITIGACNNMEPKLLKNFRAPSSFKRSVACMRWFSRFSGLLKWQNPPYWANPISTWATEWPTTDLSA